MKTCPCGSGRPFAECCEPYIIGAQKPPTAEALMRSRYSAFAENTINYIVETCTRERNEAAGVKGPRFRSEKTEWHGLKILSVTEGGPGDATGIVEFEAIYERNGLRDIHHERSHFKKVEGHWLYDKGDIVPKTT
jgi:SEC-C motif-containing protein